jgi:hypothetical protein
MFHVEQLEKLLCFRHVQGMPIGRFGNMPAGSVAHFMPPHPITAPLSFHAFSIHAYKNETANVRHGSGRWQFFRA